jgi:hypothetical protein
MSSLPALLTSTFVKNRISVTLWTEQERDGFLDGDAVVATYLG